MPVCLLQPNAHRSMAAPGTNSPSPLLLDLEKLLISDICDSELWSQLAQKLSEYQVLSSEVSGIFSSLDPDWQGNKLRARYLLRSVLEKMDKTESEDHVYSTFIEVLSELNLHPLCEKLTLLKSSTGSSQTSDIFSAKDIPLLMEKLAPVSFKWNEIGIALSLPRNVMKECESKGNNILKLNEVIYEWVMGNHEHALQPTLSNLNECLTGPLVGVHEISISTANPPLTRQSPSESNNPMNLYMKYVSGDCEVSDGKSTLLEVRASISEGVSYQWMKDSECLSDGEDYCGTYIDILVIKHAHQGMEGQYTCAVERGKEKLVSQGTKVKIIYSLEKKILLLKYACQREVPKDSWPPVITNTFTNLVLIKQTKMPSNKYSYTIRGNIDDIIESKEKIEYEKVFGQYQSGSLVLVEGRPGSGKTTLVHKVVRDWAIKEGTLKGAKLVFLVPLRLLQVVGSDKILSDLLDFIYCDSEMSSRVATEGKKTLGEGMCIVLDGLDEYRRRNATDSIVYQLTHKNSFPEAMIIVASRPVASSRLTDSDILTKRIEVIGFNRDQIFHFISNYPFEMSTSTDNIVSEIRSHFDLHPNLLHMCYLPVHAAMICYLFQDFKRNFPTTESEVYFEFTKSLILRTLRRTGQEVFIRSFDDVPGNEKINFKKLCKLAYEMTIKSEQVVNHSEMSSACPAEVTDDSFFLGFVNIERASNRCGLHKIYSFLHLTLQEYLAAVYIASLPCAGQRKLIKKYATLAELTQVWLFYFGAVKNTQTAITETLTILIKAIRYKAKSDTFLYQCAFESQLKSVCDEVLNTVLETSEFELFGKSVSPMDFVAMEYVFSKSLQVLREFCMEGCTFDMQCASKFVSFVSSKCDMSCIEVVTIHKCDLESQCIHKLICSLNHHCICEISLSECGLVSSSYLIIGKLLKDSKSLQSLEIAGNNNIGCDGMEALVEGFRINTTIKTLIISPSDFSKNPSTIELLLCNNKLKKLVLYEHHKIQDLCRYPQVVHSAMKGLQRNTSIETVVLKSVSIEVRLFMCMLCTNTTITSIELVNCVLEGDCEITDLNQNTCLHHLNIQRSINITSCFFSGLKLISELVELYISGINLGSNILSSNNISSLYAGIECLNLQRLTIRFSEIAPEAAETLAKLVTNNQSLQYANFEYNYFGSDGIRILCCSIRSCSLEELSLSSSGIGPGAGQYLAHLINNNSSIQEVLLSRNQLGSEGIVALTKGICNCCVKSMDISYNNIGPGAGAVLAELINNNQSMNVINLRGNELNSDDIIALSTNLKGCSMENINLSRNDISSDAGEALVDLITNNKIKYMDLSDNELGSECIRTLKACRQNCDLTIDDLESESNSFVSSDSDSSDSDIIEVDEQ